MFLQLVQPKVAYNVDDSTYTRAQTRQKSLNLNTSKAQATAQFASLF